MRAHRHGMLQLVVPVVHLGRSRLLGVRSMIIARGNSGLRVRLHRSLRSQESRSGHVAFGHRAGQSLACLRAPIDEVLVTVLLHGAREVTAAAAGGVLKRSLRQPLARDCTVGMILPDVITLRQGGGTSD